MGNSGADRRNYGAAVSAQQLFQWASSIILFFKDTVLVYYIWSMNHICCCKFRKDLQYNYSLRRSIHVPRPARDCKSNVKLRPKENLLILLTMVIIFF